MSESERKGDGSPLHRMRKAVTYSRMTRKQNKARRRENQNRSPNEDFSLSETSSEMGGIRQGMAKRLRKGRHAALFSGYP